MRNAYQSLHHLKASHVQPVFLHSLLVLNGTACRKEIMLSCPSKYGAGVDRADVRLSANGDVLTIAGVLFRALVSYLHLRLPCG